MIARNYEGRWEQYSMEQLQAAHPNVSFPENPSNEVLRRFDCTNVIECGDTPHPWKHNHSEQLQENEIGEVHQSFLCTTASKATQGNLMSRDVVPHIRIALDKMAGAAGFDSEAYLVSFLHSKVERYKASAETFMAKRDEVLDALDVLVGEIARGERECPNDVDAVMALLPKIEWE